MSSQIVDDVKKSLGRCLHEGDVFEAFYRIFLKQDSRISERFANTDWEEQKRLLRHGMNNVIAFHDGSYTAKTALERIRYTHGRDRLNIPPVLYGYWIDSMVEAVREFDPQFDSGLEASRRQQLQEGVDFVKAGDEEEAGPRGTPKAKRHANHQGPPDRDAGHLDHALADAYARGAAAGGHEVRSLAVAKLDFPLLRTSAEFSHGDPPDAIRRAQGDLAWADHWLIVFPLWLGTTPALLKGFLEQVMRPGFAFAEDGLQRPGGLLKGKSARVVVTMGMPAFLYRTFFRAHGVKYLRRSVLRFAGMRPVRTTMLGLVEARGDRARKRWLGRMERLGRRGR